MPTRQDGDRQMFGRPPRKSRMPWVIGIILLIVIVGWAIGSHWW